MDYARLGLRVAAERDQRGWTARELGRRADLSQRTIEDIEAGRRTNYSRRTLQHIADAFDWESGSCLLILAGQEPIEIVDPQLVRLRRAWRHFHPNQKDAVMALVETFIRQV